MVRRPSGDKSESQLGAEPGDAHTHSTGVYLVRREFILYYFFVFVVRPTEASIACSRAKVHSRESLSLKRLIVT